MIKWRLRHTWSSVLILRQKKINLKTVRKKMFTLRNFEWLQFQFTLSAIAIRSSSPKLTFILRELRGRNHLHWFCNLLDILNRLQSHSDVLEGCHAPCGGPGEKKVWLFLYFQVCIEDLKYEKFYGYMPK